jgi:oxygen-independent coproporphyrinogen-3 oxidase
MGAGAHSFFQGERYHDILDPQEYIRLLKAGKLPITERTPVDRLAEMTETSFLGLRTATGLHLATFARRFGESFDHFVGERLHTVEEAGLLERDQEWVRLSQRGRLLGNEVFFRLLPEE